MLITRESAIALARQCPDDETFLETLLASDPISSAKIAFHIITPEIARVIRDTNDKERLKIFKEAIDANNLPLS